METGSSRIVGSSVAVVVDALAAHEVNLALGRVEAPSITRIAARCALDRHLLGSVCAVTGANITLSSRFAHEVASLGLDTVSYAVDFEPSDLRRLNMDEVLVEATRWARDPRVSEIILVCFLGDARPIARVARSTGTAISIADHGRSGFRRYADLVDRLIELPTDCFYAGAAS